MEKYNSQLDESLSEMLTRQFGDIDKDTDQSGQVNGSAVSARPEVSENAGNGPLPQNPSSNFIFPVLARQKIAPPDKPTTARKSSDFTSRDDETPSLKKISNASMNSNEKYPLKEPRKLSIASLKGNLENSKIDAPPAYPGSESSVPEILLSNNENNFKGTNFPEINIISSNSSEPKLPQTTKFGVLNPSIDSNASSESFTINSSDQADNNTGSCQIKPIRDEPKTQSNHLTPNSGQDNLPAARKFSGLINVNLRKVSSRGDNKYLSGGSKESLTHQNGRANGKMVQNGNSNGTLEEAPIPSLQELLRPEMERHQGNVQTWRKSIWSFMRTNDLYESTELGGFKYITMADFTVERILWYVVLILFTLFCVLHLIETLDELVEEEIKTNQLLRSTEANDYKNMRNWTMCIENYFGGARPNEPVYDALFVAKMANSTSDGTPDGPKNMDRSTMFFFLQVLNNAVYARQINPKNPPKYLDSFLGTIKQYYPFENEHGYGFRHSLLLRKHLQRLYQMELPNTAYERKSMARYDELEFTDDFRKVLGYGDDDSANLLFPGGFFTKSLNYKMLEKDSLLKERLRAQRAKETLNLIDTFTLNGTFLDDHSIDGNATDAFYSILSVYRNKKQFINQIKLSSNEFTLKEQLKAIDQLRQLALADVLANEKYNTQEEIAAEQMQLARETYETFEQLISVDLNMTANVAAKDLADAYISLFIEPTLDLYTEPVNKNKGYPHWYGFQDIKVSLRFIDETLECFNLELPEDTKLVRVQFKLATFIALLGESELLFSDKELVNKYREHYQNRFASWWLEPAIFEPVTVPSMRLYFNEDSALHLRVDNKFELLNTSHSQCEADNPVVAFDCLTQCRRQFVQDNLGCLTNLARPDDQIHDPQLPICTPADYMSEQFRLTEIQYFDVIAKEVFLNRTNGKSVNENSTLEQCQRKCKSIPKCEYTSFTGHSTSQSSAAGSADSALSKVFSTIGNVNLYYKTAVIYFTIEQKYTFSFFIWVANCGGVLEFWLGAGLMSLLHLMIYSLKKLFGCKGTDAEQTEEVEVINHKSIYEY